MLGVQLGKSSNVELRTFGQVFHQSSWGLSCVFLDKLSFIPVVHANVVDGNPETLTLHDTTHAQHYGDEHVEVLCSEPLFPIVVCTSPYSGDAG